MKLRKGPLSIFQAEEARQRDDDDEEESIIKKESRRRKEGRKEGRIMILAVLFANSVGNVLIERFSPFLSLHLFSQFVFI